MTYPSMPNEMKIQTNTFTDWIFNFLRDQGQDQNIISNFQRYVNDKLTPRFNAEYEKDVKEGNTVKKIKVKAFSEVTFTLETGDNLHSDVFKISRGEETCFIWSIFYTLMEQVITILNVAEPTDRETDEFQQVGIRVY